MKKSILSLLIFMTSQNRTFNIMTKSILLLIIFFIVFPIDFSVYSQGTSCTFATELTTNSTETCNTFTSTATSGIAAGCTGGGFGGSGYFSFFKFTTDNSANCVSLDIDSVAYTGAVELTLWSTCSSGTLSEYVSNSISCASSLPTTFTTTGLVLTPNTTYYLAVWTKNSGTFQICSKKVIPPTNDECSGAMTIESVPTITNNFCYSAGASDPAPATFCALSDENSAWFKLTAICNGSVTMNINNITCFGGAEGFQIGYFIGTCASLTNIGCYDDAGGDVTNTITGLTAGQSVYVLIDGNAGAQCSFDISASNITPAITMSDTINQGDSITLTAYGGGLYLWSTGETTQSITVSPATSATYYCTVTLAVGCYYTLSTTVTVTSIFNMDEYSSKALLNIFPNPFTDELNISFLSESTNSGIIQIFEINSKKKYQSNFGNLEKFKINTSTFLQGFYTLKIVIDNKVINKKIIKI